MMNRAEMVKPIEIEQRLPVFEDGVVRRILRSQIHVIRRSAQLPVRIGRPYGTLGDEHSRFLFSFTAEKFSHLEDMDGDMPGKVESDRLQRLGLETMKEYGLDENISRPAYHDSGWTKDGVIDDRNGNSREIRLYPSQTIDGLAFERTKKFITATDEVLSVSWEVVDKGPLLRIDIVERERRKSHKTHGRP